MSIKNHITPDEEVLDHCTTDRWAWVCTDRRVIKYRTDNRGEQLEDISLEEITGISLTTTGHSDKLQGYAILTAIASAGLILYTWSTGSQIAVLTLFTPIVPFLLYRRWQNSSNGHFQLRGTGLIQQEPEKWKIQSDSNPDDVQSFIQTLRNNI